MSQYPEADARFQKIKGKLFFKKGAGFLGTLLCNMDFQWDTSIDTACTNGLTICWNPDFFMSKCDDLNVTILAHELWHPALMHIARGRHKDKERYNIAGDHVINLMLKEQGYYMEGFPFYMDPKYTGWSTDDVYDDLPEQPPGSMEGGLGEDIEDPGDDKVSEVVRMIVQAVTVAKMVGDAGSIPGEVTLIIDKFLNPKLPWETLMANWMNELTEQERSFRSMNRRYSHMTLPGLVGTTGLEHLMYFLDISYSISDHHILMFNSEVKHIKETFNPQRLTLVTFDTNVRDVYVFEEDDPFEKIVVQGRGGTDLVDVFKMIKKEAPTAAIIFTDMEVDFPSNPGIPVLWVCIDNPDEQPPFGSLVHLESD
ncbi:MAG: hypothetical protein JKY54_19785 [Flavobacteriales bacterium]|nr:hypothetical protein [Flavobacteriales bacterium]